MRRLIFILLLWSSVLISCSQIFYKDLQAPPPADEPKLVIDPQGHSDMVMDVMFTPDGTRLVSVSRDKTIRLWDVETGDLIKTIRGQIGDGPEGMFYAGTLSPDGKTLAVSGYPYGAGKYGHPIHLYDLGSAEQIGLLKGHKEVIYALDFSRDGKWLASGSADNTIGIWQTPGSTDASPAKKAGNMSALPVATLKGHTRRVYDIAFSPDRTKLVSASYDGTLRLWELPKDLRDSGDLKYTEMKQHTAEVRCVAYASNGEYIVSGGGDRKILLWDGNGTFIKEIDDLNGKISTIVFSADSTKIAAVKQNGIVAYVYAIPSGEKITTFTKHTNTVAASTFYGNTLVATAGGDENDIYIWDTVSGALKTHIVGKGRKVWALAFGDGLHVAFGNRKTTGELINEPLEKSLDFLEMFLNQYPPVESRFRRTQMIYQDKTLEKITNYELRITNGGTITNDERLDRRIRSYTFTPDGDVVVGSDFSLKLYQGNAEFLRKFVGHTGTVWAVSISKDGRILASASADQTIKLWNLSTGECLATLFVASDNEWVCWTPQGYYAASAGGEKYIGWHLNQGLDKAAEYYPVSVFRKRFHYPELVGRTITVGNFEQALSQINAESAQTIRERTITQILPPTARWISPEFITNKASNASVRIRAEIQSESKLTAAKVLINGRAQATGRGLVMGNQRAVLDNLIDQEITLVPGKNVITIFAANENAGATSDERIVLYRAEEEKPNLYMVSVGISKYLINNLELEYADDDAKAISRVFRSQEGRLYNKVIFKELYDTDGTQANITEAIEWLRQKATQKDVVVLFIAAHGTNEQGKYYLLSADSVPENLQQTGVSWSVFSEILGNLPSRVLLFLDTCHSGQLGRDVRARPQQVDNTEALRELSSDEYGVVILAASTGREFSLEHPDWGHGVFTKALIEALEQGQADYSRDGVINLRELDMYVADRVESLTHKQQHPTTQKPSTISRFPIVQVK